MPISDQNLSRLRAALREMQTILDDIEREHEPESGGGFQVDRDVLNEIVSSLEPGQTWAETGPQTGEQKGRKRPAKAEKPDAKE
jgi:hypothetical protein